ncbi:uncharacterized protein LOC132716412 [Ruditapes philippinarum]|uniref:uncharacterized protein LOC132716412 n=1 Tax=Ruditapes philippinarum TaxID=129788 RepID=UPI00295BF169|nr:uncharacterized protein LOC132716412 [Ruditapes philippinarum]
MASGEHVVENLFGFAELTGEASSTSFDRKSDDSQKFHFEKEKIKRDTDEVVVPILFEKSGVKKYKVLARHQVEDDEDIKRPDSSERESPNSEEQRKENINIDQKTEKIQKYKTETVGLVKKSKVRRVEKKKESLIKDKKGSLNLSNLKGKLSKVHRLKFEGKKNKNDIQKAEKSCAKDQRAINYEFRDDSDSNSELQINSTDRGVKNENYDNSIARKKENVCKNINSEKQEVVQNPFKVKCHVKLRRDPSIENFYKAKSDEVHKDSIEPELSDSVFRAEEENEVKGECTSRSPSVEMKSILRQSSSDDSLLKADDMVYNVDIQVRKSGRLQSAKCASRYRGDYGIRVDTYKQLVNKTASNSIETAEKQGSEFDLYAPVTDDIIENDFAIQNKDLLNEKATEAQIRIDMETVNPEELKNKIGLPCFDRSKSNEEAAKVQVDKMNIETDNLEKSSDQFTVIKSIRDDNLIFDKNGRMLTEGDIGSLSIKDFDKDYGICLEETGLNQEPHTIQLKLSTSDSNNTVEKDVSENNSSDLLNESCQIHADRQVRSQNSASHMKANEDVTNLCSYEVNEVRNRNFAQIDSKVVETECSEVAFQVPCSDMVEGNKPCTCDKRLDNNSSQSIENVKNGVCVNDFASKTKNEVTSQKKGSKNLPESQRAFGKMDDSTDTLQTKSKYSDKESSHYVHSVGKSVNKMQNRIKGKKRVVDLSSELTENDKSPECSPVKDPTKILESLRQRLFESAGANLVAADKATKQFESKLISSKQRQSMMHINSKETVDLDKDKHIRENDSSTKSGKSTPKCSTPRQEVEKEILEEVAKSLNVLHQAKRKSENFSQVGPFKRQKFEDKKFLLRSMIRKSDVDPSTASHFQQDVLAADDNCNERHFYAQRMAKSTCETKSCPTEMLQQNNKSNDMNMEKRDIEQDKVNPKLKPIKCSACSHIFKTKDLLRKHFPCRIRQTRTWSQNKLRPNRAVKRIENGSKKFVCKLPKTSKPEPSKSRPQLLTYRKTKFRRVKGKRRRKLYQLIQELRQKRNPVKWRHLSILYDDLSFKEQCLYKLGLICIGSAAEGLERYTAEDITVFEQHRAKEKCLTEDARNFVHSIPDISKPLSDLNVSTELSTDNQESDFFSPKHVINFPQESLQEANCDNDIVTQEEKCGATNQFSVDKTNENGLKEISQLETKDRNKPNIDLSHVLYPGIEVSEEETNIEKIVELKDLETFNANISLQECIEVVPNSEIDVACENNVKLTCVEEITTLKDAQLETFTEVAESYHCFDVAQELSPETKEVVSIKSCTVKNPLKKADVSEIIIKDLVDINKSKIVEPMDKSCDNKNIVCQQNSLKETSKSESMLMNEIINTNILLTHSDMYIENAPIVKAHSDSKDENIEYGILTSEEPAHIESPSKNVETYKLTKKVSAKFKCPAVPDIELYHQTAVIDDKLLAATQHTSQKEILNNEISECPGTLSQYKTDLISNVLLQANGNFNGILKNVEDGDDGITDISLSKVEKTDDIDGKDENMKTLSPVKGILKKTCPKKENAVLAVLEQDDGLSGDEHTEKSPKKKKIDFKTYAKRKGLIKDDDVKANKSKQVELHNNENVINNRKDIDDSDKECMRSEPSQEIEDGLLGRLLDAVNLIDSIIEEHKEQTDLEEKADSYSAITPEMAFKALVANNTAEDNEWENSVNKPYDIERIYPYSGIDERSLDEEKMHSTYLSGISDGDFYEHTSLDKCPTDLLRKNISKCTESNQDEVLPCAYSAITENLENVSLISILNNDEMKSDTENIKEDDNDKDLDEIITRSSKDEQPLTLIEVDTNIRNVKVSQSEMPIKEAKMIENKLMTEIERQDEAVCHERIRRKDSKKYEKKESESKEVEIKYTHCNTKQGTEKIVTATNQCLLEEKKVSLSQEDVYKNVNLKEKTEKIYVDNEKADKYSNPEILKSPELLETKEMKSVNENTAIKESKRDFTIKYEMNGIVVKENLLTGDKNVVENSSPFRSSAESESNCESELDVSSIADNGLGFDRTLHFPVDGDVKVCINDFENVETDAISNNENELEVSTVRDSLKLSGGEEFFEEETKEEPDHIQKSKMTLDKLTEVVVHLRRDDVVDENALEIEAVNDDNLPGENISDVQLSVSDIFDQNTSTENVKDEQLQDEKIKFAKKMPDDNSIGSPPVLEKVEVSEESMDDQDEELSCPATEISVEGEPPLLEPQHLDKDEHGKSQHLKENTNELSELEMNKFKQDKLVRQERHFLDILSIVSSETKEANMFSALGNKLNNFEGDGLSQSEKVRNVDLYKEDSPFNEDIGRNFSDVISEPIETPKSPKSKLQFLFDKSESVDITLTQIKDVLSPFSKKGKKKSISKESLLKIKSGIANLLLKAENPAIKYPACLNRDSLLSITKNNTCEETSGCKEDEAETESTCDERSIENVEILSDGSEAEVTKKEHINEGSVTDSILQMLDSLEDKGRVAENMSNLLKILSENLRFLGKGNIEDLNSDSDYSYSEETNLICTSSTENTQRELIADYLEEGEQPPSLDDIPTASNLENAHVIDFSKGNEVNSLETISVYNKIDDEYNLGKRDSLIDKNEQESKRGVEKEAFFHIESNKCARKIENEVIDSETLMRDSKMEGIFKTGFNFESSEDSLTLTCDHTKDDKRKATTIFKSITELNSIETDEESTTDEPFDPVSMSARLSELKLLSKDNNRWEFNSDFNSDDEKLDYYDSDYENDAETQTGDAIEVTREEVDLMKGNHIELEGIKSVDSKIKEHVTDFFGNQDSGSDENDEYISDGEISNNEKSKSDLLTQINVISKPNSNPNYDKETEKDKQNLLQTIANNAEFIKQIPQSFAIKSQTNTHFDDVPDSHRFEEFEKGTTKTLENIEEDQSKTKNIEDDKSKTKMISESSAYSSSEHIQDRYRVDNIFTSLEKEIKQTVVYTCSNTDQKEHLLTLSGELHDNENSDSHSSKAVKDPLSDLQKDFSDDEIWKNEHCQTDSQTMKSTIGSLNKVVSMTNVGKDSISVAIEAKDNLNSDKNVSECIEDDGDLKLILEVDVLNKNQDKPVLRKEGEESMGLQDDKIVDGIEHNQKLTTQTVSVLSRINEDTSETVTYEENVDVEEDLWGKNNDEINKDKEKLDGVRVNEEHKAFHTLAQVDKNEIDASFITSDKMSSLIKGNRSQGFIQEDGFENTDIFIDKQDATTLEVMSNEDKNTVKKGSTSLNIDDDLSDNFCESIAEKVKRKQRERSKSVCYNFNPWLYYSAAYVREVTKPAKKEFSVFRSSILEKRAREKSFSPDKELSCSTRKKRNSSVPKEDKYETEHENDHTKGKRMFHDQHSAFQIKPCSVLINKLGEDAILRYTRRKRKLEESTTESRPPIKVTIKLSQIVYPPPNSPYGSTSTSSDNYRSGYESCSEESETDTLYETKHDKEFAPNPMIVENVRDVNGSNEKDKSEVNNREPLKIKIRTLRPKVSSNEENQISVGSFQKNEQIDDFVGSFNELSSEGNTGTSSLELLESEVLLDIKRECEKVKSREDNVMFYLSEADSDKEQKKSAQQISEMKDKDVQGTFGLRVFSKSSVQAECGESDIDLSESDTDFTDSELQEKIDKILNSKSRDDCSEVTIKDDENNKKSLLKGKNPLIKMIVSDLHLSESESGSEYENNVKTDVDIKHTEKNILQENAQLEELNLQESKDLELEDKLSQDKVLPLLNVTENITNTEDEYIDKHISEDTVHVTEKCFETMITKDIEPNPSNLIERSTFHEVTDIGVLQPEQAIASSKRTKPSKQDDLKSPALNIASLLPDEGHVVEHKTPVVTNTKIVLEPLDLSVNSKNSVHISAGLSYEEEMGKRSNITESVIDLYPDNPNLKNGPLMPRKTLNETVVDKDKERTKLSVAAADLKVYDHHSNDKILNSQEILNKDKCNQQNSDEIQEQIIGVELDSDLNDASYYEKTDLEIGQKTDVKNCPEGNDNANGIDIPEKVLESSQTFEEMEMKNEMSEEDTKQLENISAVKNLEEDIFHDVQPIQNGTEDGMIYYAVELSDDLETSEAVVNLETVELIEGPVIIENNDTLEENVIGTNVIQSHTNNQFELSSETLNEQIVEILNEPKIYDESRINCALENMTQMENATVNDSKSKYLYGINEDSQSSNEVVEELVTELVNDDTVIDVGHVSEENQQTFPAVASWETFGRNDRFLNVDQQRSENSQSVFGNDRGEEIIANPENFVQNEQIVSECSVDQFSRNEFERTKNSQVVNTNFCYLENVEHVEKKVIRRDMDWKLINEISKDKDHNVITDNERKKTKGIHDIEGSSHCKKLTSGDNDSSQSNISFNCSDVIDMPSGQESWVPLKSDNLSCGNDLGAQSCKNVYIDSDTNRMCAETSDVKEDMYSSVSEGNSFVKVCDNYESSAMMIDEENDYIITQNEHTDDDDDDEDDAMETE